MGGANQFVHNLLQFVHSLLLWTKMTVDNSRNVVNLMLKEPARRTVGSYRLVVSLSISARS